MSTASRKAQRPPVPVLALKLDDAASALGMSTDFFNENVRPEIRIVRRGRMKLAPVSELQSWLDSNASYAVEP